MSYLILVVIPLLGLAANCYGTDMDQNMTLISSDPDYGKSMEELIVSRGFYYETHNVVTQDGYILVLYRVINPLIPATINKRPVILHHGLLATPFDFVMGDPFGQLNNPIPSNNLAFTLAKLGCDIWLPNTRGNGISMDHKWLDKESKEFWNFSFDEMIQYDLPAVINYILRATGRRTVGYVGHSQGTLIMFGLLASQPQYAEIIKPYIALAPVAFVNNAKGLVLALFPFRYLMAAVGGPLYVQKDVRSGNSELCKVVPDVCEKLVNSFMGGFDSDQINTTRINVYVKNEIQVTSAKNLAHYFFDRERQLFASFGDGQYNPFGSTSYGPWKITSRHMAFISGSADDLADKADVDLLRSSLRVPLLLDIELPGWGHIDIIFGVQAAEKVGRPVAAVLERYRYEP